MHPRFLWIGSENESGVSGDSQLSAARRIVAQAQPLQAHRFSSGLIDRHESEQPLFDRMAVMFKRCVTLTMPRTIRVLLSNRFGCWRPHGADLVVADVDGCSGRIADRIVEPRRETIVLAIAAPDTFGPRLGNQCPERRVRHDIDPRKRCMSVRSQVNNEFLPVLSKAAETVKVFQFHKRQRRRGLFVELARGQQLTRLRSCRGARGKLLTQCASSCDEHHACSRLKCEQLFFRNLCCRAEIDAAGLIDTCQVRLRFGEPTQMLSQWFLVTRDFLAHQDEIDLQAAQMPEGMCCQYLSHDLHVAEMTNHNDDNRQITRNALSPQRPLTFSAAKTPRRRSKLGLWKDDQASQLLKRLHIGTPNVQPAHLKLRMGPCSFESAHTSVKLRIAPRQCNNRFARICHDRDKRKLKPLVRQNRHAPAQAEYWIEHGTDTVR